MMGQRSGTNRALRESEAWRIVAESIATEPLTGSHGLCRRLDKVIRPAAMRWLMDDRIDRHLGPAAVYLENVGGSYPHTRYDNVAASDVRVLAAPFLALEAEDEERATRRTARKAPLVKP